MAEQRISSRAGAYETPRIDDHGDLLELTAGSLAGTRTDMTFPVHTPKRDLTFTTPAGGGGGPPD